MIRLPPRRTQYPRTEPRPVRDNAWGSQWQHLPRAGIRIVRNSLRDALRTLRR